MPKKVLAFFIFFFLSGSVSAQSVWDNYNKYWYYRYRLTNQFMAKGLGSEACDAPSGLSMPAASAFYKESADSDNIDLYWSDGTIALGWYIGVLATEFKLLSNSGEPTDKTLEELYFAMKAYERLDRKAERLFYPRNPAAGCSDPYLNGLFVRDDVGEQSFANYPELRLRYEADQQFTVSSWYTRTSNGQNKMNAYPSQDQIAHLMIGFALVKRCLGETTYQSYHFKNNAVNYVDKIASKLEDNGWIGKLENGEPYQYGDAFLDEFTAYGIAKAAEWITGQNYTSAFSLTQNPLQRSGWALYGDPSYGPGILGSTYYLNDQDFTPALIQAFAAIGSSWEFGFIPVRTDYTLKIPGVCVRRVLGQPVLYPCAAQEFTISCYHYELNNPAFPVNVPLLGCFSELPTVTVPVTTEALSSYGVTFNQSIFALLHEYLHAKPSHILNFAFENLLNSAPCRGPHHKPTNDGAAVGANGWRAANRWVRPLLADGYNEFDDTDTYGEFNGLDYMLLHNLYLLSRNTEPLSFKNRMNQTSSAIIGPAGNYWSYETLVLNGLVTNFSSVGNQYVELKANEAVILKPGFQTQQGALVRISTADINGCNTARGQSSNLRTEQRDPETLSLQQMMVTDPAKVIQQKLQTKMDSVAATLRTVNGYVPLGQYLNRRAEEVRAEENEQYDTHIESTLYPNPAKQDVQLEFFLSRPQDVEIRITSMFAYKSQTLFSGISTRGRNVHKIKTENLEPGIYFIEIKGQTFSAKNRFVKVTE